MATREFPLLLRNLCRATQMHHAPLTPQINANIALNERPCWAKMTPRGRDLAAQTDPDGDTSDEQDGLPQSHQQQHAPRRRVRAASACRLLLKDTQPSCLCNRYAKQTK